MPFAGIGKSFQRYKDNIYRDIARKSNYTLTGNLNGLLRTTSQRNLTETSMDHLYDSLLNLYTHIQADPSAFYVDDLVCITRLAFNIRMMLIDIFGDYNTGMETRTVMLNERVALQCLQSQMERIHCRK
eukprot:276334_1